MWQNPQQGTEMIEGWKTLKKSSGLIPNTAHSPFPSHLLFYTSFYLTGFSEVSRRCLMSLSSQFCGSLY